MQVGQVASYTRAPSHPWWRREPVTHCASAQEVGHEGAGPWLLWRKMDCTPPQWHVMRVGRTDRDRSLRSGWSAIVTAVCGTYAISPALPPPMLDGDAMTSAMQTRRQKLGDLAHGH